MRGTITVARCACGEPVIGGHKQPMPNRFWCAACVAFVDAAIRGSDAFHGYLPEEGIDLIGFLKTLEERLTRAALERSGTVAGAARLLGLNRTTLAMRIKAKEQAP